MTKKLIKPSHIEDELIYNTQLPSVVLGEYGRLIQDMAGKLLEVSDKNKRTQMAHALINSMASVNPQSRETSDYRHKLWDHLHILTNYKLDVDCPYPIPSPSVISSKPAKLTYTDRRIRYRYYGKVVENYLQRVATLVDGDEKNEYIRLLGSFLKSSCKAWNDENVSDQAIIDQMNELSGNALNLSYDGQEFSIDMARSGKSVNPLRVEDNQKRFNKNNRNNRRNNRMRNKHK